MRRYGLLPINGFGLYSAAGKADSLRRKLSPCCLTQAVLPATVDGSRRCGPAVKKSDRLLGNSAVNP